MEFIALWLLFAVIVGAVANSKGRSGVVWFLVSFVFSPLIGLVFVLIAGDSPALAKASVATGMPSENTHVRCSQCYELIMPQAKVCRYCGIERTPSAHPSAVESDKARHERAKNAEEIGREIAQIVKSPTFWVGAVVFIVILYLAYGGTIPGM